VSDTRWLLLAKTVEAICAGEMNVRYGVECEHGLIQWRVIAAQCAVLYMLAITHRVTLMQQCCVTVLIRISTSVAWGAAG
jgi:hypothetical protein